jgi:hypothetical protein
MLCLPPNAGSLTSRNTEIIIMLPEFCIVVEGMPIMIDLLSFFFDFTNHHDARNDEEDSAEEEEGCCNGISYKVFPVDYELARYRKTDTETSSHSSGRFLVQLFHEFRFRKQSRATNCH